MKDEKSLITRESNLAEKESEYFRKLDDLKNKSAKNLQDKTANEKRSKELDEKSESLSALETDLKVQQKEISEEQKINSDNAKQNERNLDMVKAKLADYRKVEFDHYYMKRNLETDNLITTSFDQIEKQIVDECRNGNMTLSESVHHAAESFGKKCRQIAFKFQKAIRCFTDYLEGKTSGDFRKLADDMDRNHALNFDQYDEMKASGNLDWQKKKLEEQIILKTVKKQIRHEQER